LIRFVKQKFDRVSYNIKPEDFKKSLVINLMKSSIEIDEIEIKNKLTGNLKEDIKKWKQRKNLN
jgi:predicted FMN-binding regulatory protein PaiB